MFKISSVDQTYTTPVTVEIPDGAGKATKVSFKMVFKRLPQTELDELFRRCNVDLLKEGEELLTDDGVLERVAVGWHDVLDEQDRPLEFNDENFTMLKEIYPARKTISKAFFDSLQTAKRKN